MYFSLYFYFHRFFKLYLHFGITEQLKKKEESVWQYLEVYINCVYVMNCTVHTAVSAKPVIYIATNLTILFKINKILYAHCCQIATSVVCVFANIALALSLRHSFHMIIIIPNHIY